MYMPLDDLAVDWQDKAHRHLIAVGVKALIDGGTTVGPEDIVLFANLLFCSASGEHRARVARLFTSMISDGQLSQAVSEGKLVGFVVPPLGIVGDRAKPFDTV
jgi:hypothetical protein